MQASMTHCFQSNIILGVLVKRPTRKVRKSFSTDNTMSDACDNDNAVIFVALLVQSKNEPLIEWASPFRHQMASAQLDAGASNEGSRVSGRRGCMTQRNGKPVKLLPWLPFRTRVDVSGLPAVGVIIDFAAYSWTAWSRNRWDESALKITPPKDRLQQNNRRDDATERFCLPRVDFKTSGTWK